MIWLLTSSGQRPSTMVQSINEVEDQVEWRAQSGWRRGCGGGFALPTQEVGCVVVVGVWWLTSLCPFRLCCTIGIVCGLPWVDLGEWASLRNRTVLVVWPGCLATPLQPSFRSIEYIKCTLPALAATPLLWTWLNESGLGIFYLMDVFHVV